jgi:hypothetical protein
MPHFTVLIGSEGPVIDLVVSVGRTLQRRLAAPAVPSPSLITVRALIDTGADLSAVHPQVLHQLGVQATRSVRVRRPGAGGGFRVAWLSDVELAVGGVSPGTHWIATRVVGVALSTPTVLALIGRDLLVHCALFYNGPRGELTLSC